MSPVAPYHSLADPVASSVLAVAVRWIEGTVMGTIATSVALIAVATLGMIMLAGRISVRRGATVLAGCFVLFGAPVIARGIQGMTHDGASDIPPRARTAIAAAPLSTLPTPQPLNYDPYAGASVPIM